MYRLYDISMTICEEMQVYKNKEEKKPKIWARQDFTNAKTHESQLSMDVHAGTHLDAALHMIPGGKTIEAIPLERLVGPARVLDLTDVAEAVTKADLERWAVQPGEWILLKTRNSLSEQFDPNFVYLAADGALYAKELQLRGIGTDGLGIERAQPDYMTHKTLLENDICIVEGLRLKDVPAGTYFMVIAPLKLTGIDAAPARAFLIGQ
jgi:arylformamidase